VGPCVPARAGRLPSEGLRVTKYFPPVGRIDAAAGDRNLVCSCPPIEEFATTVG
jgi:glycine dehydrogenase